MKISQILELANNLLDILSPKEAILKASNNNFVLEQTLQDGSQLGSIGNFLVSFTENKWETGWI